MCSCRGAQRPPGPTPRACGRNPCGGLGVRRRRRPCCSATQDRPPATVPHSGWRHAARELREALRRSAQGLEAASPPRQPLLLTLGADGEPRLGEDGPLAQVAAAVATTCIRGTWSRIKICPADDCRWAFYDASRNRSRSWCSMAVCGNRAKARNHRARPLLNGWGTEGAPAVHLVLARSARRPKGPRMGVVPGEPPAYCDEDALMTRLGERR